MMNAFIPLLSSIVGGMLVLAGQYLARRAEDRRVVTRPMQLRPRQDALAANALVKV